MSASDYTCACYGCGGAAVAVKCTRTGALFGYCATHLHERRMRPLKPGERWVHAPVEDDDTHTAPGDCFMVAGKLVRDQPDLVLVHGTVLCTTEGGTAKVGQRHWHAWCERTYTYEGPWPPGNGDPGSVRKYTFTVCIDRANGHDGELPAELYYKIGQVQDIRRYTPDQARVLMLRTEHWGPWDE